MKSLKIILPLLILSLLLAPIFEQTIYAKVNFTQEEGSSSTISCTEVLENGDYIVTIISSDTEPVAETRNASKTITKTKTSYYKNSAGAVLWSISIKATFTYNGKTSQCTSCSHSTTAPGKFWSIKSCKSSKSGNKATATATATHTTPEGAKQDFTRTVTITCSATGTVS